MMNLCYEQPLLPKDQIRWSMVERSKKDGRSVASRDFSQDIIAARGWIIGNRHFRKSCSSPNRETLLEAGDGIMRSLHPHADGNFGIVAGTFGNRAKSAPSSLYHPMVPAIIN